MSTKTSRDEELLCQRETGNNSDPFAVGVLKDDVLVGHVPRKISFLLAVTFARGTLELG